MGVGGRDITSDETVLSATRTDYKGEQAERFDIPWHRVVSLHTIAK